MGKSIKETGKQCSTPVAVKIKPIPVNAFLWRIRSRLWSLCNFWLDAFKCSVLKNISNKNQRVHQSLYSTQWRETYILRVSLRPTLLGPPWEAEILGSLQICFPFLLYSYGAVTLFFTLRDVQIPMQNRHVKQTRQNSVQQAKIKMLEHGNECKSFYMQNNLFNWLNKIWYN